MRKSLFIVLVFSLIILTGYTQNVGIGTDAPLEKLHVAGNIKADTVKPSALKLTTGAGDGKVLTSDANGNASWKVNTSSGTGNLGLGVWGDCSMAGNLGEYYPVTDADPQANDNFGISVAMSGDYTIVGAYADDVGGNVDQGSANIYHFNGVSWEFMQKLTDPTGAANDEFGITVSISGNYAVVGSPADDIGASLDQGSACIFHFNGSSWVFLQKITDVAGATSDNFGFSVAISGNYIVVGAYVDDLPAGVDQGSAFVFQFNNSTWSFMQKLTDLNPASNDYFGISVGISGNYIIIGADRDDGPIATDQGSVSIFRLEGPTWQLMQKITDLLAAQGDRFGNSVAISGNYALIGAWLDDQGPSTSNVDPGSASIYKYNGSSWIIIKKLVNFYELSGGPYFSEKFGYRVAISGDFAMIGAPEDDEFQLANDNGSSTLYLRLGQGWQKQQYILDPLRNLSDNFGSAVSLDGNTKRFVIGARRFANNSGKVVFGKIN